MKRLLYLIVPLALAACNKTASELPYEVDEFQTPAGKTVRMHALMHASIRIEYNGLEFEIDPCPQLGERTVDYSRLPKADYILVTHEHHDHYNAAAIDSLSKDQTRLVMNPRCVELYGSGTAMSNGDRLQLSDDILIEAVPAYNTTEDHLQFHPQGRDNGYLLTLDGLRIYIAGDTEPIPEMEGLGDIDIAFLPCNQPYTMTPDQILQAARTIRPKVLFPYHYGSTDLGTDDSSPIATALKNDGITVKIRHYE